MKYGSVCSGIEAASQAWHPMGWKPSFFSEIEDFPRAVLKHHYPDTPLHGDFTTIEDNNYDPIDLLVGGTPCQSFSIAGLRGGLDDDRGNLALEYLRLAQRLRPKWLVWENVPGVLSSNGGRDFGSILGGMVELGYGFAYRVLDAQNVRTLSHPWAVPQRRRRVFVVGYFGDWRRAAAVLFDRESMSGNPKPRREAGKVIAGLTPESPEVGSHWEGSGVHPSLNQSNNTGGIGASNQELFSQRGAGLVAARMAAFGEYEVDGTASTVKSRDYKDATDLIAFNSREDPEVTGDRAVPLGASSPQAQAIAFAQNTRDEVRMQGGDGQIAGALAAEPGMKQTTYLATPYTIPERGRSGGQNLEYRQDGTANTILTPNGGRGGMGVGAFAAPWAVRRLTPIECERLQGFPDEFTNIPWRGKDHSPDGRRYKALGNSMAVNCMRWIGDRIAMVEAQA